MVILTIVVMLLACNLSCHVTKQLYLKTVQFLEGINASSIRRMSFAFHKVQWRHFSGVVGRFRNTFVEFLQDSAYQKLFKSVFLTELFENKYVAIFGDTLYIDKTFHSENVNTGWSFARSVNL